MRHCSHILSCSPLALSYGLFTVVMMSSPCCLAGNAGLLCSYALFGLGIVPGPPALCEAVELPECHSCCFFLCDQYSFPWPLCNQLFVTRKKTDRDLSARKTEHMNSYAFHPIPYKYNNLWGPVPPRQSSRPHKDQEFTKIRAGWWQLPPNCSFDASNWEAEAVRSEFETAGSTWQIP